MVHPANLIRPTRRSNKFHWQPVSNLAYSARVSEKKQRRHRRRFAVHYFFMGRQQRRNEMARRVVAADLDGQRSIAARRPDSARDFAIQPLARRMARADFRAAKTIMAARRIES